MTDYEVRCKHFDELTLRELYEILKARQDVFVVEQNCPYLDMDGKDYDSLHLFICREDGSVAACLRVFHKPDEPHTAQLGRIVTTERGCGLGRRILHEGVLTAENVLNAEELYLEAQQYAIGFYQKEGFAVTSDVFLEDGIPHVEMRKRCLRQLKE